MLLPRRVLLGSLCALFSAGTEAFGAPQQKRKPTMPPTATLDEKRLLAFFETSAKYDAAPVPTPLNRSVAVAFINAHANRTLSTQRMRKLARLAIFYHLRETAPTFLGVLTGKEDQPDDIVRAALCLIAVAWVGDAGQQTTAQRYFHGLQDRADVEIHRAVMLEVVEALGPREGTGAHRQWIQKAISVLEAQLQKAKASQDIPAMRLAETKINRLSEYVKFELAGVDRAFSRRERIDAMAPAMQIQPLVAYSLSTLNESTPQLSFWASMRLLGFDAALHSRIAAEFLAASTANVKDDLLRARALRAAGYFGATLPEGDRHWLEAQPDSGVDPLALRPQRYAE